MKVWQESISCITHTILQKTVMSCSQSFFRVKVQHVQKCFPSDSAAFSHLYMAYFAGIHIGLLGITVLNRIIRGCRKGAFACNVSIGHHHRLTAPRTAVGGSAFITVLQNTSLFPAFMFSSKDLKVHETELLNLSQLILK